MLTASTPLSSLCRGKLATSFLTLGFLFVSLLLFVSLSWCMLLFLLLCSSPQLSAENRVHVVVRGDDIIVGDAQT